MPIEPEKVINQAIADVLAKARAAESVMSDPRIQDYFAKEIRESFMRFLGTSPEDVAELQAASLHGRIVLATYRDMASAVDGGAVAVKASEDKKIVFPGN